MFSSGIISPTLFLSDMELVTTKSRRIKETMRFDTLVWKTREKTSQLDTLIRGNVLIA
jgi:hypothetical protein